MLSTIAKHLNYNLKQRNKKAIIKVILREKEENIACIKKICYYNSMRFLLILFFIFILFRVPSDLFALEIDSVKGFYSDKGNYLILIGLRGFPTQEILLALKRQKNNITLIYEVDIYRKGFIRDELLDKIVYYQRAGYFPEKNFYFLEDNYNKTFFSSPEEVILKLSEPPLFSIRNFFSFERDLKKLYFFIQLSIGYTTHFNEELRYIGKERQVILRATKKYVPF